MYMQSIYAIQQGCVWLRNAVTQLCAFSCEGLGGTWLEAHL